MLSFVSAPLSSSIIQTDQQMQFLLRADQEEKGSTQENNSGVSIPL